MGAAKKYPKIFTKYRAWGELTPRVKRKLEAKAQKKSKKGKKKGCK